MSNITTTGAGASERAPTIENRSIDYVPWSERHGLVWQQGPFWFTSNFVVFTMTVGFTGPLSGLGFGWSTLAIALGNLVGAFFMAFHANQGPQLGVPQMIQSRAQFGTRGTVIPVIAALFVYVGLNVFNTPMATQGIQVVAGGGNTWLWYVAIIAVQAVIALVGYDMIHLVQRWLTYVLIAFFAVLTVGFIAIMGGTSILTMGAFNSVGFLTQCSVVAGYMIAYAIYVSDYTRYLPADTKLGPLVAWTYAGVVVAGTWLMGLGALFAIVLTDGATVTSIYTAGNMIAQGFGSLVMILAAIAVVTVMSVNTYGATLVGITAIDGFRPIRPTLRIRVIGTIAVSLVVLILALSLPESLHHTLNGFLALILYFLVPWSAVNLVDYYWVRRGQYSVIEMFSGTSMYGRWAWRGLVSYAAGFIAMVPFFVLPFYVGPIGEALGNVDLSFIVGLPVSGLTYYLLARNLDLSAEKVACQRSLEILEPGSAALSQSKGAGTSAPSPVGPVVAASVGKI